MHILSDEQYNRLMAMKAYLEDPAPLPEPFARGHEKGDNHADK